jgi:hypothetical protein
MGGDKQYWSWVLIWMERNGCDYDVVGNGMNWGGERNEEF